MKILQLNIWGGKLSRQIVDLLRREQPDVVCLQEVITIAGGESFFFEDLEEIQKHTGYEHAYHAPSHTFNLMKRKADWGNAILSRSPFLETADVYTYGEPIPDFDFLKDTDYNTGRVLQHAIIETENGPLHILNHHGYHVHSHKNGDDETLRQCGLIADYVKGLEGRIVLCGDFNLLPDSSSIELINSFLVNHVIENKVLTTRTPLTHKTEACDFIFTSPDIEVKSFQVLDDIVSDHKALTIDF